MAYPPIDEDPRLTAYALGELDEAEKAQVEARLAADPEAAQFVDDVRRMALILSEEFPKEIGPGLAMAQRQAIEDRIAPASLAPAFPWGRLRLYGLAASVLVIVGGTAAVAFRTLVDDGRPGRIELARADAPAPAPAVAAPATVDTKSRARIANHDDVDALAERVATSPAPAGEPALPEDEVFSRFYTDNSGALAASPAANERGASPANTPPGRPGRPAMRRSGAGESATLDRAQVASTNAPADPAPSRGPAPRLETGAPEPAKAPSPAAPGFAPGPGGPPQPLGSAAQKPSARNKDATDLGDLPIEAKDKKAEIAEQAPMGGQRALTGNQVRGVGDYGGYGGGLMGPKAKQGQSPMDGQSPTKSNQLGGDLTRENQARGDTQALLGMAGREQLALKKLGKEEAQAQAAPESRTLRQMTVADAETTLKAGAQKFDAQADGAVQEMNVEQFAPVVENAFFKVTEAPLSTFGIDVDTASYTNVRRFLLDENRFPPRGAVRVEELVNYFDYDTEGPKDDKPFAVNVEFARCPWLPEHRLARIALKGRSVPLDRRPPSNLVFLIDVSGSMRDSNKMPWVKSSLRMLVDKLTENDRVAIVVYAFNKGLALAPTTGDRKDAIMAAIDRLEAGGSTNGGEGLNYAYALAQENFVAGGINRIILCTDGDFNTGDVTDLDGVTRLAESKRATKVKLTVLGFGQGNLQDAKLEALANKGDGQYAYIDNLKEAHRVLVEQMSGTLQTIAKDVKIQVDFNPRFVSAYRLIGYENRALNAQDFRDDTKDAGEIGAGHTVTAFYQLVPAGVEANVVAADTSKFLEAAKPKDDELSRTQTLLVKLAYKPADGDVSTFFEVPARDDGRDYAAASADYKFSAAVAEFGLLLLDSAWKGQATYDAVLELGGASQGADPAGRRKEFLDIVGRARNLSRAGAPTAR